MKRRHAMDKEEEIKAVIRLLDAQRLIENGVPVSVAEEIAMRREARKSTLTEGVES